MLRNTLKNLRRDQSGMALVELLVSGVMLVIVSVGVFTAFETSTRVTGEERHRAQAHAIAEADLARIQSMRIADLATLNQTRTVTQDGTNYTVTSTVQLVAELATTSTCAAGTGSQDYLKATSRVTWPTIGSRPAVTAGGVVSPPSGSVIPNTGSLLVDVDNSRSAALSGVGLSGSGAGSFSGSTGSAGCVLWRNIPAGNYSMAISGAATGKVDPDGNAPTPQTVSVVSQSTNTVSLLYDTPGTVNNVTFQTRNYSNALVTTTADSIVAFNSGMNTAKRFGTPGSFQNSLSASGLFPFTSPYEVYPGLCAQNDPGPGVGTASVTVPVGGSASPTAPVQLPSLQLYVLNGISAGTPGAVVGGATVKIYDTGCPNIPTAGFARTQTSNSSGQLPNPGLPFGNYQVCASANVGGTVRRNFVKILNTATTETIPLTNFATGALRGIFLGAGALGGGTGSCP